MCLEADAGYDDYRSRMLAAETQVWLRVMSDTSVTTFLYAQAALVYR